MAARRTKKPCEYCEVDYVGYYSDMGEDLMLEVYPGKMIAAVAFFRNQNTEELEEAKADIPMNFCPNCGRDLRDIIF